jgi:hypothetical protein
MFSDAVFIPATRTRSEYSSILCDNESRTISYRGRKQKIKRESTELSGIVIIVIKRILFEK